MEEAAEEVTGNSLGYFPVLYPSLDCSTELWVHVVNWSPVITIWVSHRHNGSDLYKTRNLFLELRLFPCLLIRSLAPPVVSGLSLQNQNLVTRVLLLSFGPHPVLSSLGSTLPTACHSCYIILGPLLLVRSISHSCLSTRLPYTHPNN